ncbi:hypothetical protein ACWGR4_34800 [Embleya sp. NPDC055664]
MQFRARFAAAALIPPLLVLTAACGGSDDKKDDAKAPDVGSSTAGTTTGVPGGGGSGSGGAVAAGTKGYKLVVPEAIDAYTRSGTGTTPGAKEADDLGVKNAQTVSGVYNAPSPDPGNRATVGGTRLTFYGFHGEIADPAKSLDAYLANVGNKGMKGSGKAPGTDILPVGGAKTVKPAGFEGALMKCQVMQYTRSKGEGTAKTGADFRFPVCAWADYATLGGVDVAVLAEMTNGGDGVSPDEAAALTAKLYNTTRQKV